MMLSCCFKPDSNSNSNNVHGNENSTNNILELENAKNHRELKRLELENVKIHNELKQLENDHIVFVQTMYPLYILEKVRHKERPHAWETTRFHPNVTTISIGIENAVGLKGLGILNYVFDIVCTLVLKYNYCKLDTTNDCFHVAVNLFSTDDQGFLIPSKNSTNSSRQVMEFATELIESCKHIKIKIGIDTNTCYSGLVGTRFIVFGDSIKKADQLQIECQPGCINASQATLDLVKRRRSFSADDVLNKVYSKHEKLSYSWKLIATSAMNAIQKKEYNSSSSNLIKCSDIESSQCLPEIVRDRKHSFI